MYVAALILGNSGCRTARPCAASRRALGWLAHIGLFVLLGLLAAPHRLVQQLWPALALGVVLTLVARPLSVLASLWPFRMTWREQTFLSWAGLRGAVPVVLATVPATMGVPGIRWLFDLVFVLVVVYTLMQAPTLPWLAGRLRLDAGVSTRDVDVESSPLGDLGADVLQVKVGEGSRLHGVEVFELRLPPGLARHPGGARRRGLRPRPGHGPAARRQPAGRDHGQGPGAGRAPDPPGQPARPPRRLGLTPRAVLPESRSGAQIQGCRAAFGE